MNLNFFTFILILIILISKTTSETLAAEVSFTIDDPGVQSTLNMDHIQVGKRILKTLSEYQLKTTLFICGKRVDNAEGQQLLSLWDKEGHILASHSYSHENYNSDKITFNFLSNDIIKNEKVIQNFKNFRRVFRYPMLKEGNTEQKRDSLHTFLKQRNYSLGYVTIDASDWYISDRLVKKMNQRSKVDLDTFKKYYLIHIWDRAQYYNNLSKRVLGREIKHNVLIHHNPLNALFLDDLIKMFKSKGWKLISTDDAFKDPVYSQSPKILPAGESLLWALAKESGKFENELRYPGEDGDYLKEEMDRLGL